MFYVTYQLKLELHWWGRFHEKKIWIGPTILLFEKNQRSTCLARLIMELLVLRFWCVLLHICFFCFHLSICCFVASFGDSSHLLFTIFVFYNDLCFDGNMMVIWRKWKILHFPLNFDSHGNLMEMFIVSFEWLSMMKCWHIFFLGCVLQVKGICIMLPMVVKNLESWTSMHNFFCKLILQINMYQSLTSMCEVCTSWYFKQIHIKVQLQIVKHLTTTRYSLFGDCFLFYSMEFLFEFYMVTFKPPSLVHGFVIYHYRMKPKFSWSQHWLIIKLLYISCFFVISLLNRKNFLSFFVAYKAIFNKVLKKHDGNASLFLLLFFINALHS